MDMPNVKSAEKRLRQNEKRRERNRAEKSKMRTAIKKAETAISDSDAAAAKTAVLDACKALDKTAQKGVVHKNMADRKKSRLVKMLNKKS